jgi:hypothetical protein
MPCASARSSKAQALVVPAPASALARLADWLRAEIGLWRAQARHEAAKPFRR